MNRLAAAMMLTTAAMLAACGSGGAEPPEGPVDTSYEQSLPAPVRQGDSAAAPVPDNTSVADGPDEQVDELVDREVNAQTRSTATEAR